MLRFLIACALAAFGLASAQPSQPPIFLVNGYQFSCFLSNGISGTYGALPQVLGSMGIRTGGYDTCECRGCSIEQHAAALAKALGSFRNADGSVPLQVDVIAHSMGGLIVRAYLAGKGLQTGPPAGPAIRKLVLVATPNFGLIAPPIDTELSEMQIGSRFLWELGTWNQNSDDLRGIDAIAIAGSGGNTGGRAAPDDGLVPVSSAAIAFATDPERTRVLPYCHGNPIPFIIQCRADAPPLAEIDSTNHPVFRIIRSFLTGTEEWRTIGDSLAGNGGVYLAYRDASDKLVSLKSAALESTQLATRDNQVYYREWLPAKTYTATLDTGSGTVQGNVQVPSGGIRPLVWKDGPVINRVSPAAAVLPYLSLAPGSIVSIYGANLSQNSQTTVLLNNQALTTFYVSPEQVNALLPAGVPGLLPLTIRNSLGQHTINILLEPAAPAVFSLDASGKGPAAAVDALTGEILTNGKAASPGSYVSLFATGLGETQSVGGFDVAVLQPQVTVGGRAATVQFAGRAPGYSGLDQINIQIPAGVSAGDRPVQILSGRRASNVLTIPIH